MLIYSACSHFSRVGFLAALIGAMGMPACVRAGIVGFGDFSQFSIKHEDLGAAPSVLTDGIELTNPGANERRSIFHKSPQPITHFQATFTYQAAEALRSNGIGYGASFTLQNSASGSEAVGGAATGLGYSGVEPSVGITLELRSGGNSRSGLFFHGALDGGSAPTEPVDFFDKSLIDVTIDYNGSLLTTRFVDRATRDAFNRSYVVDLPELLGSDTAYVGFTASTGAAGFSANAYQRFTNFTFVPEPEAFALGLLAACTAALACPRRLLDGFLR